MGTAYVGVPSLHLGDPCFEPRSSILLNKLKFFIFFSFIQSQKYSTLVPLLGHAVVYWLRQYDTRWKVAGSRHDELNDFQ
jgi:hypothetical protein